MSLCHVWCDGRMCCLWRVCIFHQKMHVYLIFAWTAFDQITVYLKMHCQFIMFAWNKCSFAFGHGLSEGQINVRSTVTTRVSDLMGQDWALWFSPKVHLKIGKRDVLIECLRRFIYCISGTHTEWPNWANFKSSCDKLSNKSSRNIDNYLGHFETQIFKYLLLWLCLSNFWREKNWPIFYCYNALFHKTFSFVIYSKMAINYGIFEIMSIFMVKIWP